MGKLLEPEMMMMMVKAKYKTSCTNYFQGK